MKKHYLFLATLFVAAAVSVAVVSCKKETPNTTMNNKTESTPTFNPREIKDMKAYLKDFKQKMESATKDDDEILLLEDAAWHLASLANCDFCKINVEYDDVQFDTIEMKVDITDGTIQLSSLSSIYVQLCTEIDQFKKSFTHSNQNLYFLNVFINGDGNIKIALMTTFSSTSKGLDEHLWYFPDIFYIDSVCEHHFNSNMQYNWDGCAKTELQRILNLFEHHVISDMVSNFIPTRNHTFNYDDYDCEDPYGSPFILNSRLFAAYGTLGSNFYLTPEEMCYCLDSYLGLGYDYIVNNYLYDNEHPVSWTVNAASHQPDNFKWRVFYHTLTVQYGELITGFNPKPSD